MPQTEVASQPFAWFSWAVVIGIVAVVFCIMYFYVRRKRSAPRIDKKAGDEGED